MDGYIQSQNIAGEKPLPLPGPLLFPALTPAAFTVTATCKMMFRCEGGKRRGHHHHQPHRASV